MSANQMSTSQVQIISSSATREKGEPFLRVHTTSKYGTHLYTDQGSDAYRNVSLFRPIPDTGWFIVGDYAQGDYQDAYGTSYMVQEVNPDSANPILMAPTDYVKVWTDAHSGAWLDGSIWHPIAPDGYVSIGDVGAAGHDKPTIPEYRCVRVDFAKQLAAPVSSALIWSDENSRAWDSVSLHQITGVQGVFIAQGNYDPFAQQPWKLAFAGS